MNAEQLRALQAPWKERYRQDADSAVLTLRAEGRLDMERVRCIVAGGRPELDTGLHPAAGGDGTAACAGDMLLQALVGCAGVTLVAVATAMSIPVRGGIVRVEGDLDFRGTLGVAKDAPVGFKALRLSFDLDADATPEQLETLVKLSKRYCVVYQTLQAPPPVETTATTRRA